jgi:aryl carrier-like protein
VVDMTGTTAGAPPTLDQLRAQVAAIVGTEPETVADDAELPGLGLDSLGMMRLVNGWRRAGIRVSSRELATVPTLSGWHRVLTDLWAAAAAEEPEGRAGARTGGG